MKKINLDFLKNIKKENLEKIKIPRHTKNCHRIITGGYKRSIEEHSTPDERWICDEGCPIKNNNGL